MRHTRDGDTTKLEQRSEAHAGDPGGALLRVLGLAFGVAVSVGSAIGSGILRFPGEVAAHLPSPGLFLGVWIAGALYALVSAPSFAELGTMMPRAGAAYLYAQRALGPYPAFVVGWIGWVGGCASAAAVATILADYLGGFSPMAAAHPFPLALLLLFPFPMLHWLGVRWGSGAQQLTTFLKLLAFAALITACFMVPAAGLRSQAVVHPVPAGPALFVPLMLALQGVIFTYGGWNAPIGFSEELHRPERDIPRSIFSGVALVIVVYLLVNAALVHAVPLEQIAGQKLAVGAAAGAIFGPRGETLVRGLALLSVLGVQNAGWLGLPRVLLAMSRDGIAPARAARVNRGGTPTVALVLSAATAVLFLLSGTFQTVLATTVLLSVSIDAICYLSVIVLRRREPEARRPYRAWGYPWTTGAALGIALGLVLGVAVSTPVSGLYTLLLLGVSYPAFRWVRGRVTEEGAEAWGRRASTVGPPVQARRTSD
jgi:amino acid transporter